MSDYVPGEDPVLDELLDEWQMPTPLTAEAVEKIKGTFGYQMRRLNAARRDLVRAMHDEALTTARRRRKARRELAVWLVLGAVKRAGQAWRSSAHDARPTHYTFGLSFRTVAELGGSGARERAPIYGAMARAAGVHAD